jgi:putative toxin-antitoxin system antitoxin component (TIGR02293 family)
VSQFKKERRITKRGRPSKGQVTLIGTRTLQPGDRVKGVVTSKGQVTLIGTRTGPKAEIVEFSVDPVRMEKVLGATTTSRKADGADVLYTSRRDTAFQTEHPSMQSLTPVLTRAIEVFGNSEKATRWMERPNRALGQKTPIEMLGTEEGRKEVEELLGRIEYGVYS